VTAARLREFVADTPAEEESILAAARSALSGAFTVAEEPGASGSGTHRRTWLDTFDWRLYKAGLTLEYAAGHRDGELRLSIDTAPAGGAVQPVTGWRASRPRQLSDLPDGSIATSISGIVGIVVSGGFMWLLQIGLTGKMPGWDPPRIVPWSAALAFTSLVCCGVVAGLYPASRAARLDPIEALRRE